MAAKTGAAAGTVRGAMTIRATIKFPFRRLRKNMSAIKDRSDYETYKPKCTSLCMFLKVVFRKDRKAGEHKMCPNHFCKRLKTSLEKSLSGFPIRNENCDFWKDIDGYGEYWESGEPLPSVRNRV
jgi:hypothetical protein